MNHAAHPVWIMPLILLALFCVPGSSQTPAPADADVARGAAKAFHDGLDQKSRPMLALRHFSQATDLFLDLHERGMREPALYRNLGNAAVLADRWPIALWAYEMGLKLDPNDALMREQRAFVRAKVQYPTSGQGRPEREFWPAEIYRPSVRLLACVAGLAYALAWLAGTMAYLGRSSRLALLALSAIGIAALAGAGLWHGLIQADVDRETPLVIMADKTKLYRGNGSNYPAHTDLPMLAKGMEARQIHRRGAWTQLRLSSGETGWVPTSLVLIVAPY